uniref:UBR-type domain-containing protein n=1 Tax=Ciona savignyi TaxID=51511 RepID=H2Y8U7_CIOSA
MSSGQRSMLSASHVPEDLINQVQNVLQGKSRNIIIRELQRTSLDVNLAVNNLLSRDDEDNDDMEDAGADYIHGEELMSLFDGAVHSGEHPRVVIDAETMLPEDLLGYAFTRYIIDIIISVFQAMANQIGDISDMKYPSTYDQHNFPKHSRSSGAHRGLGGASNDRNAEREDPGEDRQGSSTCSDSKNPDFKSTNTQAKPIPGSSVDSGLTLGSDIEWWTDGGDPVKFKLIGAMFSELAAVDCEGHLRHWKWSSEKPYPKSHPRTEFLELGDDKISFLAASSIRSSVVTEGGAVATWMDESVSNHTRSLESPRSLSESLRSEKVKLLTVCPLYSAVLTETGRVFWWGILPFNQRKKLLEKSQNTLLQTAEKTEITVGSQVCLRSLPSYHAGSIAINTSSGTPRVGKLLEVVWSLDKKCLFKILSSEQTSSKRLFANSKLNYINLISHVPTRDESATLEPYKPGKRKRESSEEKEDSKKEENEEWDLREVVFVEDIKSVPIGKVEKYDSQMKLHSINAMETGINAVASKASGKLSYIHLSLTSGKVTSRRSFQTKIDSFLGKLNRQVQLSIIFEQFEFPTLLQDYNSMLYPLLGDENGGIKDPIWADIPPLFASGMGAHAESDSSKMHVVTVLVFRNHVLMPLILRRDLRAFEALISSVESNKAQGWFHSLCEERCDGQRNLLHMCIDMTIPSSNKEQKADEKEKSKSPKRSTSESASQCGNNHKKKPYHSTTFPAPEPISTRETPTNRTFMSSNDRMEAVNAIANAISSVNRSSPQTSRNQSEPILTAAGRSTRLAHHKAQYQPGQRNSPRIGNMSLLLIRVNGDQSEGINLSTSDTGKSKSSWNEFPTEMRDRGTRSDALAILKLLCRSKCIQPYLKTLLTHKDTSGYTPFMFAVAHRAYSAAQVLYQAAINIAKDENIEHLMPMLYPTGSSPDDNPLYMLCCNDTCSFTWTGTQHINQDIFECLTCGLTERRCCCTECARVCHKGHDCKLKRANPTAFCDCWEKCACKSLVAGDNNERIALLRLMIHTTDLYERPDSSGQHIMQFLIQTVARQLLEHGQYRPPSKTASARMTLSTSRTRVAHAKTSQQDQDMPEHDLRPPQFCRNALLEMLDDWPSLRSLILGGCGNRRDNRCMSSRTLDETGGSNILPEDGKILSQQTGTSRLDLFTHTLVVKCPSTDFIDKLLETIIHTIQTKKGKQKEEGILVARRFIRSVIRVYIVLTAQLTPEKVVSQATLYRQP